jgi:hypothetical protein
LVLSALPPHYLVTEKTEWFEAIKSCSTTNNKIMYFEPRTHELVSVSSAHEAAEKIKDGTIKSYQVATWPTHNDPTVFMYAVPDGHLDNMMLELAMLRKSVNEKQFLQVESITNGWIDSIKGLADCLLNSETANDPIFIKPVQIIFGQPEGHEIATFECSCCGESFRDNVKKQLAYDQDSGYGVCPDKCAARWH